MSETIILKTITGSKLHGLDTPASDTDYRGVFMADLLDHLSPYRKVKNTSWIEGDKDDTSYELSYFCKMLSNGNPSALEVLWSNMVEQTSDIGEELKKNKHKFLDTTRIFEAHKGYAVNQYKKMNLFEPDDRTPKFAVAYVRSMQQGIELLETGEFSPQVERNKDFLFDVKTNFNPDVHTARLGKLFSSLQKEIVDVFAKCEKRIPDGEWIEQFLLKSYLK